MNQLEIHNPLWELTLFLVLICESTLDSLLLTWINSRFPSIYVNITLIDLYWIPVHTRELTFDSRLYLESSQDFQPLTRINLRFTALYVNRPRIHALIWKSTLDSMPLKGILIPNSHPIKELWLRYTSVTEIKYG